jgi:hypothetical protein
MTQTDLLAFDLQNLLKKWAATQVAKGHFNKETAQAMCVAACEQARDYFLFDLDWLNEALEMIEE